MNGFARHPVAGGRLLGMCLGVDQMGFEVVETSRPRIAVGFDLPGMKQVSLASGLEWHDVGTCKEERGLLRASCGLEGEAEFVAVADYPSRCRRREMTCQHLGRSIGITT